jgi:hypothetical protein
MTTAVTQFEVTIGEFKTMTLLVDMKRASKIGDLFEGLVGAWKKITNYEPAAFVQILMVGAGKTTVEIEKEFATIEAAVFETGMSALRGPLEEYLNLLSNGGRPVGVPQPAQD